MTGVSTGGGFAVDMRLFGGGGGGGAATTVRSNQTEQKEDPWKD